MSKMADAIPAQGSEFGLDQLYMWVKGLESKVNNLLRETNVLKNDFIKRNQDLKKEVRMINEEVLEIKHNQERTLQKMDLIIKELKKTAGMEEMMVIKKYMEFWNPLNFVTQRDLERAIESKLAHPVKKEEKK